MRARHLHDASDLKLVYTPLNGSGKACVLRMFWQRIGIRDVTVVPEQAEPDGNFPTCPYPNPEIPRGVGSWAWSCAEQIQARTCCWPPTRTPTAWALPCARPAAAISC